MMPPTVAALAVTSSAPPVSVRRGVGMRTVVMVVDMVLISEKLQLGSRARRSAGGACVASVVEGVDGGRVAAERAVRTRADGHVAERRAQAVVRGDDARRGGVAAEQAHGA